MLNGAADSTEETAVVKYHKLEKNCSITQSVFYILAEVRECGRQFELQPRLNRVQ